MSVVIDSGMDESEGGSVPKVPSGVFETVGCWGEDYSENARWHEGGRSQSSETRFTAVVPAPGHPWGR